MTTFTIPGMHSWQRPRAHRVGDKLVMFTDSKTREFVALVALLAKTRLPQFEPKQLYGVNVVAYTKNQRSRDIDRVLNGILDGLVKSGRVGDDRYCWQQTIERRLTDGEERIEVSVFGMEPKREGVAG